MKVKNKYNDRKSIIKIVRLFKSLDSHSKDLNKPYTPRKTIQ